MEVMEGMEGTSPMAKMGRMEQKQQRRPFAILNHGLAAEAGREKKEKSMGESQPPAPFTVYQDAVPAQPPPTKSTIATRAKGAPLKERKQSWGESETEALLAATKAPLMLGLKYSGGAEISREDSGVVVAEGEAEMSLCSEPTQEEDEEEYASVASSVPSSSYYTAPLASVKDLHREQITTCPVFADDIFAYLLEKETSPAIRISRSYMAKQSELSEPMRHTLVDWMVEVGMEYGLEQQTLHLAVRYVDRFLSLMDIPRHKLQLIGTTALMIAAKLEEIYPPELKEFVFITDDTYSEAQLKRMERIMLQQLEFQLHVPTHILFLARYQAIVKPPNETISLSAYLADLALLSLELSALRPSLVAAGAFSLASLMTGLSPAWPHSLESLTSHSPVQVLPVAQKLSRLLHQASAAQKETSVRDKYAQPKYHNVSSLPVPSPSAIQLL